MPKVTGNIRESADGLRKRDADSSKARLREARQRVARAAAKQRGGGSKRGK